MKRIHVLSAIAVGASIATLVGLATLTERDIGTVVVDAVSGSNIPPPGELAPDASPAEASSRLGACREDPDMFAPPAEFIADTERWLEIVDLSIPEDPNYRDHLSLSVEAEEVEPGARQTGQGQAESIRIYGESVAGIEWANRADGRAFVGLASEGRKSETAIFALIQHPGGQYFFAGDCSEATLTSPLESRLDARFDEVMERMVGTVGRAEILELLDATPDPAPSTPVRPEDRILNPAVTDQAVLRQLDLVTLQIDIPEQWAGTGTVCSRSAAGWNDCLDLSALSQSGNSVTAYLDESRALDFWLLDAGGDIRAPIQRLGRVEVGNAEQALSAPRGSVVRVRLTGTMERTEGKEPNVANSSAQLRDVRPIERPTISAPPTSPFVP